MNTLQNTPIIYEVDYVLLGGSMREVAAAISLAKEGRSVLLLTSKTYLLDDLSNSNHCIDPMHETFKNNQLKQLLPQEVYQSKGTEPVKWVLHPDKLKQNVEKVCEEYGIKLLYHCVPLDIRKQTERMLLRVGGKFGVCAISCQGVLDLMQPEEVFGRNHYYVHIMNLPRIDQEEKITICSETGSYEVSLLPGSYNESHGILQIPCEETYFTSKPDYYINCKQRCLEAFGWLKRNKQVYANITLGRFVDDAYSLEYDYEQEFHKGMQITKSLEQYLVSPKDWRKRLEMNARMDGDEAEAYNPIMNYRNYSTVLSSPLPVSSVLKYDLIVVGGGTAGAMAALHAARNDLRTLLLESNLELGGTGTIGGVSTYWFGKRFMDVMEVDEKIQNVYDELSIQRKPGIWSAYDDCNAGIKSMVLAKLCQEAGVTILYQAYAFGILKKQTSGRITGVLAATRNRVLCCYGKYVVDATGDGDLASFAGAKTHYGSKRDHITYWASLAQYSSPDKYRNNFSSSLMVGDPIDYTRFIKLGRCRGDHTYDHGSYVSPRESRHIVGGYEIDLKDIVSFHTYEDGIYTCFSNYDPKGKLSADMIYAGVLPPQVSIQIPLRALLPVDQNGSIIMGLIVAGKAISCTHNAFPSIRMQPDLMHQGAVVGRILAEAIQSSVELNCIDPWKLKTIITKYTGDTITLPLNCMSIEEIVQTVTVEDRCHWVDLPFEEEVRSEERSLRIMTANSQMVRPLLEQRYWKIEKQLLKEEAATDLKHNDNINDQRSNLELLAGYLLWHGSDIGAKRIIESILQELRETEGLPIRKASTMCAQLLPDHGVMPEVVYRMNLLAYAKNELRLEPFAIVLQRLKGMNRDYMDIKQGIYHYIEVFPYVAERTGQREFLPWLMEILTLKEFVEVMQTDNQAALLTERLLILVLSMNRALARCGERVGYDGLIGLLSIESLPIAASACLELETLTGKSYGLKKEDWSYLLNHLEEPLRIQLITEKLW